MGIARPPRTSVALLVGAMSLSLGGCALPRIEAAVVDFQRVVDPLPKVAPTATAKPAAQAAPAAAQTPAPAPADPGQITATTLAARVTGALKSAKSVRIVGSVTENGEVTTVDTLGRLDLSAVTVTYTIGTKTAQVIKVGTVAYLKANQAFWTHYTGSYPAPVRNKWVKFTGTKAQDLLKSVPLKALVSIGTYLSEADLGTVTAGQLDGAPVLVFTQGRATNPNKVYVNPTTWLPMKAEGSGAAMTFTQWNSAPAVTAPPAGQTITI